MDMVYLSISTTWIIFWECGYCMVRQVSQTYIFDQLIGKSGIISVGLFVDLIVNERN
jgi:hypothetical protein